MRSSAAARSCSGVVWLRSGGAAIRTDARTQQRPAARATILRILHRSWRTGGALVRARQPVAQVARRLVRRAAVEGHQRCRHARDADDAGAPTILRDRSDLDQVRPARDGLFEAMKACVHDMCGTLFGSDTDSTR